MACPDSFGALPRASSTWTILSCKLTRWLKFLADASHKYGLDHSKTIAVGYSNGANIAASLLLTHPRLLSGAVLFRPMVPFRPNPVPNLKDVPVLLAAARRDQIVPPQQTSELSQILTSAGARVTIHWHPGGHELGADDVAAAKDWLLEYFA